MENSRESQEALFSRTMELSKAALRIHHSGLLKAQEQVRSKGFEVQEVILQTKMVFILNWTTVFNKRFACDDIVYPLNVSGNFRATHKYGTKQ